MLEQQNKESIHIVASNILSCFFVGRPFVFLTSTPLHYEEVRPKQFKPLHATDSVACLFNELVALIPDYALRFETLDMLPDEYFLQEVIESVSRLEISALNSRHRSKEEERRGQPPTDTATDTATDTDTHRDIDTTASRAPVNVDFSASYQDVAFVPFHPLPDVPDSMPPFVFAEEEEEKEEKEEKEHKEEKEERAEREDREENNLFGAQWQSQAESRTCEEDIFDGASSTGSCLSQILFAAMDELSLEDRTYPLDVTETPYEPILDSTLTKREITDHHDTAHNELSGDSDGDDWLFR